MFEKIKYIVFDNGILEAPIVFSNLNNHDMVAHGIKRYLGGEIISAGFAQIKNNKFVCFGESETLKLKSRGNIDSDVLNMYFGL